MVVYNIKCIITSKIPVVPDDPLRYVQKKNKSADIYAFINGIWIKIGFAHIWPDKLSNPSIKFKLPNPYEIKLLVSTN